ncbi:MAG: beta-lactamase family protein [Proteobacteria bacterium]|nr:beta-lactamase family protein [Pseudomonadota bacterium]
MRVSFIRPAFLIGCVSITLSACTESREEVELEPLSGFEEELNTLVPKLLHDFDVPGAAVGIIQDGEIWMKRGFGYADVATNNAIDTRTAFNIGSISKTVASWGVMKLVETADVDLNAPASTYLTRWQLPESEWDHDLVTIRRMLSHTAGLSLSGYPGFQPGEPLPTVEESLSGATNGVGGVYVAHQPGSRWQYSGGGYTLAQLIVEEVTGRPFAEYMETEILKPLGMTSSSYIWDADIDRIAATPYGSDGEPVGGPRFTAMAAAGLATTLDDFTRFALASMTRLGGENGTAGVLRSETLMLMQTPVEPADDYGLGYSYKVTGGVTLVGHGGANEGWMAVLSVAPMHGDGLVVMTNGSNGNRVHRAIRCAWQFRVTGEAC